MFGCGQAAQMPNFTHKLLEPKACSVIETQCQALAN
jgi:hypothetical protein